MGASRSFFRRYEKQKAKSAAGRTANELREFYASHFVSTWQAARCKEIQQMHAQKQEGLDMAHDIASSRLVEEFMRLELDYLRASDEFKEKNPGEEMSWAPEAGAGFMARVFIKNIFTRAKRLGLNWHGKNETVTA